MSTISSIECAQCYAEVRRICRDPAEYHLTQTLALEAVRRCICLQRAQAEENGTKPNFTPAYKLASAINRMSVYREVRQAAQKVLVEAEYPFMSVTKCFGDDATNVYIEQGFDQETIRSVLQDHIPDQTYYGLVDRLDQLGDGPDIEQGLAALFHQIEFDEDPDPLEDPVMLFYVYMAERDDALVEDTFLQERLNSRDRFERYVALVGIAHMIGHRRAQKMRREVVPDFVETELISDVRSLALQVAEGRGTNVSTIGSRSCALPSCCEGEGDDESIDRKSRLMYGEFERLKNRIAALGHARHPVSR